MSFERPLLLGAQGALAGGGLIAIGESLRPAELVLLPEFFESVGLGVIIGRLILAGYYDPMKVGGLVAALSAVPIIFEGQHIWELLSTTPLMVTLNIPSVVLGAGVGFLARPSSD